MKTTFGRDTHMMPRADYDRITLAIAATKRSPAHSAPTDDHNFGRAWNTHAIPKIYGQRRVL